MPLSQRRLAADHPDLAFNGDPRFARAILEAYAPADDDQADAKACMLQFMDEHPRDAHLRECAPGHLTASALILHSDGTRALFTLHRKLNRWLQPGGHCDGDANLAAVALREAIEESGINDLVIVPEPVDLDIHLIPERKGEPDHVHLDTRYLVLAPKGAEFVVSEESHDLAWLTLAELEACADGSVLRLARRFIGPG
jgi:8-oxo-dGTP pyrophosphatase MutT (NUDIX family)